MLKYIKKFSKFFWPENTFPGVEHCDEPELIDEVKRRSTEENLPLSGNDMYRYYDAKRMTSCIDFWKRSDKKFYIINDNFEDEKFYPIDEETIVLESCLLSPGEEENNRCKKLQDAYNFMIVKPYNVFTYNKQTETYEPYRKKIKITV